MMPISLIGVLESPLHVLTDGRQPKRFQKRSGKGASEVAWTTASESQWEWLTAPVAAVRRRPRPWRSLEQAESAGAKNARRHARKPAAVENIPLSLVATVKDVVMISLLAGWVDLE
ncbi:hypothetical protein GW17_00027087 [Ensete ventricosum]|nr:hypothetical protein GW17_00027087 [Ensete ventricosum]